MTPTYEQLPGFEAVYLEDSFVLDVAAHPGVVRIDIEVVLTPRHPRYQPPRAGEQYCYHRSSILFESVDHLSWTYGGLRPAVDADGETDFGGIDEFGHDGSRYVVTGDFGRLELDAGSCRLAFDGD